MKFIGKKTVALTLCLCIALGLMVPATSSADAAAYEFPEFGPSTYLGEHITGRAMREYADYISYGGEDYMLIPYYGGKLYIFRLSEYLRGEVSDSWVYDVEDTSLNIPKGIDSYTYGTTPKVFVAGDSSKLAIYTFSPGNSSATAEIETYTLSTRASISNLSIDSFGNVFLAAECDGKGQVYRLTWNGDSKTFSETLLYETDEVIRMNTLVTGDRISDDYIYVDGTLPGGNSINIYKIHYAQENQQSAPSIHYPNTPYLNYLSCAGNMLFGNIGSTTTADGFICIDTTNMTASSINIVKNGELVTGAQVFGVATEPENGICYMNITGVGFCEYNIATNTATFLRTMNPALRVRALYHYAGGAYVMTMNTSGAPYLFPVNDSPSLNAINSLTNEGTSNWSAHTIGAGVPGVGPAAYVGGYLTSRVASFDPQAATPLNHNLFSQGNDQTDSTVTYQNKLYMGCYSGAYLVEYDPATGTVRQLIPDGLRSRYNQRRIHTLAAGDNKIFFATIPDTGRLGGAIGWYDLTTDELYVHEKPVTDQSVVTLAYDEENDILYCGTTIRGGVSSTPSTKEAVLMAYDVNAKEVLATTTVSSLTGDLPKNISGLAKDAKTGKFWGLVSHTIFSFGYEDGKLNVTKEWAADTTPSDPYTNSGGMNWFPKAILFDGNGDMYLSLNQNKYGIMKFTLDQNRKIQDARTISAKTTRVYNMGSDGNIYYALGYDLYRISLNNVSIAEDLIYAASADDAASVATAKAAYNALSETQQESMGIYYRQKLQGLLGKECVINSSTYSSLENALKNAGSGDTITLLTEQIGNVTITNGAALNLNGMPVAGNITVVNGTLELNGSAVTGDVTVVNGTVTDATDGTAGITGAVVLQQDNGKYLPLLDGSVTRFFSHEAKPLAVGYNKSKLNHINFWFDLEFSNLKAYELISSGSAANLSIWAELYVDGKKLDANVVFDAKLKDWAGNDHTGEDNWAMYVEVSNIPTSVKTITINPCLCANGMTVSMGEMPHAVKLFIASPLFGLYPTDLVY